jgi:hypothetical protein
MNFRVNYNLAIKNIAEYNCNQILKLEKENQNNNKQNEFIKFFSKSQEEEKIIKFLCNKINSTNTEQEIAKLKSAIEPICKFFNISIKQAETQ